MRDKRTPKDVCGEAKPPCSLRGRLKKGRGRGEGERENPPPLFPFLPIPYPLPLSTLASRLTPARSLLPVIKRSFRSFWEGETPCGWMLLSISAVGQQIFGQRPTRTVKT